MVRGHLWISACFHTRGRMSNSLAYGQRSLRDPSIEYPLWPVLTSGCPRTSTEAIQYPVEVSYRMSELDRSLFDKPPEPGLQRWAPLLPPLEDALDLGEGATPLIAAPRLAEFAGFEGDLYLKDESRNPTWSHKDRLNRVTVSAAVMSGARGVVVASPGNHGASAAAYSARAGIPCVVIATAGGPPTAQAFLASYGAAVIAVPRDARWPVMRDIVTHLGFHPVSNVTRTHTGHGFGAEGYKTVAYEIFLQLGRRVPAAIYVPTGYAELLFGVYKGFCELRELGLTDRIPAMIACEPAARAPLANALAAGLDASQVPAGPTAAFSIGATVSGYRGVVAVRQSGGAAVPLEDQELLEAQQVQARAGFWHEPSSAAALAGLRKLVRDKRAARGVVVLISTSSGLKDAGVATSVPEPAPDWPSVQDALRQQGIT